MNIIHQDEKILELKTNTQTQRAKNLVFTIEVMSVSTFNEFLCRFVRREVGRWGEEGEEGDGCEREEGSG